MSGTAPIPRVPRLDEGRVVAAADAVFDMEDSIRHVAGLASALRALIGALPENSDIVAIYAVARALDTEAGAVLADWEAANSAVYKARYGE